MLLNTAMYNTTNFTNSSGYTRTSIDVRRPIQLTVALTNAFLHTLGFLLLLILYRRGRKTVQVLYLVNISMTEGLMNYLRALYCIIRFFPSTFGRTTHAYFWIKMRSGLYYMYFFSMFFLTLDRLLTIFLPFKFPLFWTKRKTKYLMGSMWILNVGFTITLIALHRFNGFDSDRNKITHFYIPSMLNVLFFVFAILSYSLMFWRFASSSKATLSPGNNTNKPPQSLLEIFRKSKFFVPILLVSSFLVLTVIPNFAHALLWLTKPRKWYRSRASTPFKTYNWISIYLSDTTDALIYIMMYTPVRTLLSNAVDELMWRCCGVDLEWSDPDMTTQQSMMYRVSTRRSPRSGRRKSSSTDGNSVKKKDNLPLIQKHLSVKNGETPPRSNGETPQPSRATANQDTEGLIGSDESQKQSAV